MKPIVLILIAGLGMIACNSTDTGPRNSNDCLRNSDCLPPLYCGAPLGERVFPGYGSCILPVLPAPVGQRIESLPGPVRQVAELPGEQTVTAHVTRPHVTA
jgi:hypothetical protein